MAQRPVLEFFYDCSSPWTYLAIKRVIPLCEAMGADIDWRPIIVGGVFNAVNQQVYAFREGFLGEDSPKSRYFFKDMADWARMVGIDLVWPEGHPINAVKAMRGALYALDQGSPVPWSLAVCEAYWGGGDHSNIADEAVLRRLAENVGLDAAALLAATADEAFKARLRANTDEVIARGGFGSPTMFVGDDMYFGNDRLELVRYALERASSPGS